MTHQIVKQGSPKDSNIPHCDISSDLKDFCSNTADQYLAQLDLFQTVQF